MLQFDLRVTVHSLAAEYKDEDDTEFNYSQDTLVNLQAYLESLVDERRVFGNYYFTVSNSKEVK